MVRIDDSGVGHVHVVARDRTRIGHRTDEVGELGVALAPRRILKYAATWRAVLSTLLLVLQKTSTSCPLPTASATSAPTAVRRASRRSRSSDPWRVGVWGYASDISEGDLL